MTDDAITDTSLDDIDALRIEAAEQRARGTPLYVTEEAIDRNPWAAVILDLPKDAPKELLERITETALNVVDWAEYSGTNHGERSQAGRTMARASSLSDLAENLKNLELYVL